jgi:nitrate/TMAO reductase-like tetraheme cytochrome c subunit
VPVMYKFLAFLVWLARWVWRLARAGYTVVLACRTEAKAHAAMEEIKSKVPSATLDFIPLDLIDREIARLKANDSQECRNCHEVDHMQVALQSKKAQAFHKVLRSGKSTCIDCHAGLTHTAESTPKPLELGGL